MQLHEAVKKNKLGLNRLLSAIFISILIFSIYNRTLSLGFDIRFLVFPFFISSLILAVLVKVKFGDWVVPTRAVLLTLLLTLIVIQDQIAWQFSDLDKNTTVYKNVIILYIYNFLIAIYFLLNKKYLNDKVLINSVLLSSFFLSLN